MSETGQRIVPVEPTLEMLKAGYDALQFFFPERTGHIGKFRVWEAMLAAAPDNAELTRLQQANADGEEKLSRAGQVILDLEGQLAKSVQANAALVRGLQAATGYLLNAKIDLETGAPKRTAINTIDGGLKAVETALASQ